MFKKFNIEVHNHTLWKNEQKRRQLFDNIDLKCKYVSQTKIDLQKSLKIGQKYLDIEFERQGISLHNFQQSSLEREIVEFIKTIYKGNIQTNVRDIIHPYEIDIFLPDLRLGIEIHGLYWHSLRSKKYHTQKAIIAEKSNIKLLQFFEDEINDKSNICKSIIETHLGINKRIYARVCSILEITGAQANNFCNSYHLQGSANASKCFGLFYDNELLAVMTFRMSRFEKQVWELIRFCTKSGFRVVGGASKLLKKFTSNYTGKIISYADRRISNGNLYSQLGFKLIRETQPNYFYVINKRRSNRMNWQKKKLINKVENFTPDKTEEAIMNDNGFYRIYDAGNLVYVLENE
jgi:very-short-patch-repair endonuclease